MIKDKVYVNNLHMVKELTSGSEHFPRRALLSILKLWTSI
jgi:hypothetical protein